MGCPVAREHFRGGPRTVRRTRARASSATRGDYRCHGKRRTTKALRKLARQRDQYYYAEQKRKLGATRFLSQPASDRPQKSTVFPIRDKRRRRAARHPYASRPARDGRRD